MDIKIINFFLALSLFFFIFSLVSAFNAETSIAVGTNEAPIVSSINFNDSNAIILTEGTTTTVYATTTITDNNYCSTIDSVVADFYRSGVLAAGCDDNAEDNFNNCYARIVCSEIAGTCSGDTDTTGDYLCPVDFEYFSDPTDTGTYSAQNWEVTITASDATSTAFATSSVELNTLTAFDVTSSINYQSVAPNSNTGATNEEAVITNTGNSAVDLELSGEDMVSGGNTLSVSNQEYSTASFSYGGGTSLSTTPTALSINLPKPTSQTPVTATTYWGIGVPSDQVSGTYTGNNIFTAVTDEFLNTYYNDTGDSGNSSYSSSGNVTNWGGGDSPWGVLVDYDSGNSSDISISYSANTTEGTGAESVGTPPVYPVNNTDAYTEFGEVINMAGISYTTTGNDMVVTLSGLDSSKKYTLVALGMRGAYNRWSRYTLSGASSFVNQSSSGATVSTLSVADDSTTYNAGDNYNNGYVAKWTDIDPISTTLTLTVSGVTVGGDTADKAYLSALKLVTESDVTSLSMSSAADQTFTVDQSDTTISPITISDALTPSITAENDIRIRIPEELSMVWATSTVANLTITGSGANRVSGYHLESPYSGTYTYTHKVNLHGHTTQSDGSLSPTAYMEAYRDLGYTAAIISDHDMVTVDPSVSGIFYISGDEYSTGGGHMSGVNISSHYSGTRQQQIDSAISEGGFAVIHHPVSDWTNEAILALDNFKGIEIWNGRYASGESYVDYALSHDKEFWLFGSDDLHLTSEIYRGFNVIFSDKSTSTVTVSEIIQEIENGNFFVAGRGNNDKDPSTAGQYPNLPFPPYFTEITVSSSTNVTAKTDKAVTLDFITNNGTVSQSNSSSTEATYSSESSDVYVRVKATYEEGGQYAYAWSNPLYVRSDLTTSFEDNDKTLVIDVVEDFASGESITISGISFSGFTATSSADNLELEIDNNGAIETYDIKTITISEASTSSAPELVQQNTYAQPYPTSGTSITVDLPSPATAGNLLVTGVAIDKNSGTISAPSGFTLVQKGEGGISSGGFAYKVATGGETSITWSWTVNETGSVWIGEYSGLQTTGVLDVSAENESYISTATNSISTGTTGSTSQADELVFAVFISDSGNSVGSSRSWTNGFTTIAEVTETSGSPFLNVASKIVSSVGTLESTVSHDGSDESYALIAGFKIQN